MKLAWFALGVVTGTASTYVVLTRVWWPDVRLAAARTSAQVVPSVFPQPLFVPTPPEAPPPEVLSDDDAPPLPSPSITELKPGPLLIEPAASPSTTAPAESRSVDLPLLKTDLDKLRARALLIPVQGIGQKSLRDTFGESRGSRHHEAIDILAPRGTPVLAVDDGPVEKLFTSKLGGLTVYQFDPQGEYCYYYAHLDRYATALVPGKVLRRGDVIGYVGTTGNAPPDAPHLHFTIFRLGSEKRWWEGTAINAYPLWGTPAGP